MNAREEVAPQRVAARDGPREREMAAREAQRRGEWGHALAAWEACLRDFSHHTRAPGWRNERALALLELGRSEEAEKAYQALVAEYPNLPVGYVGVARMAQRRQNWNNAVEGWNTCLARFPDHTSAPRWRAARAAALESLGAWAEAYEAWDALASEKSTDAEAFVGRARCLLHWKGWTEEVERLAAAAVESFPEDPAACRLWGAVAEMHGDHETVLARHLEWIKRQPKAIEAYQRAMEMALRMGDSGSADGVVASAPPDVAASISFQCRVLLGNYRLRGEFRLGVELIERIDANKVDRPCADAIAMFQISAQRFDDALGFTERILRRFPADPGTISLHLQALHYVRGEDVYGREKERLLSSLGQGEAAQVLRRLPSAWLSPPEVRRVIDDTISDGQFPVTQMMPALRFGFRGEDEIVARLVDRFAARGGVSGSLLAALFASTIRDRRRIVNCNMGEVLWRDFSDSAERLRSDVAQLLARASEPGAMPGPLADALSTARAVRGRSQADWVDSAECYTHAASLAEWFIDRVCRGEPTSVIRLGDGEGAFLPYPPLFREFQEADQRSTQAIWWGEERIVGSAVETVMHQFGLSTTRADAIGIPPSRRLILELGFGKRNSNARGLASVLAYVDSLANAGLESKILISAHAHSDLHQWNLYQQMLAPVSSVSVIACHDLAATLAERFGVAVRRWLRVPPEFKYARMFGRPKLLDGEPFYPSLFERLLDSVDPRPGEVFLIAAGFLGKILCDRIRERGGIALDIGSVADQWLGFKTRGATDSDVDFDVASSLIDGQPFTDTFETVRISGSELCRSDRSRRRNLTPAFSHLFAEEPEAPTSHSYPLRVIGHPRCGSAYTRFVLNSLGLALGHEHLAERGICSWIHAVDDLNPPYRATATPGYLFRVTVGYVRDPNGAIPSIVLENCKGQSFAFRRFHIARRLGVDIAKRRDPLERAVESYLSWMAIIDLQRPLFTVRVERIWQDLETHTNDLIAAGIILYWTLRDGALTLPTDPDASVFKSENKHPHFARANYLALPADLADALARFCELHGYANPAKF